MVFVVKSKFLKVKCECGAEQVIFGNASSEVKCLVCGKTLASPTGSRARVECKILEVL